MALDLNREVLKGLDEQAQKILLEFIGKVVSRLSEETGLKIFDDMKEIAQACYQATQVKPDSLN